MIVGSADSDWPVWLENEKLLHAVGGAFKCRQNDLNPSYGDKPFVTSHRLCWRELINNQQLWKEIRLSDVMKLEHHSSVFTSKKVLVRLRSGDDYDLRVMYGKCEEFYEELKKSVATAKWTEGGYKVASESTGIGRVLKKEKEQMMVMETSIGNAMVDLDTLRRNAEEMVRYSRVLKRSLRTEKKPEADYISSLLQNYGIGDNTASRYDATDPFFKSAHASLEVVLDKVLSLDKPPQDDDSNNRSVLLDQSLEKTKIQNSGMGCMNGMILLHELYCVYNRYPGVTFLSPSDFVSSVKQCVSVASSPYTLKDIDCGKLLAVQLRSFDDEKLAQRIVSLLENDFRQYGTFAGCSAVELADALKSSVSLAHVQLQTAESMGYLCRDESVEGLKYFVNRFKKFDLFYLS